MPKASSDTTKRVVALYLIAGFGHLKPALALIEQLKKYPVETEAWDIFADASGEGVLDKNSIYNRISTHPLYLKFWNQFSNSESITRHFVSLAHWFDAVGKRDITKRIRDYGRKHPDTAFVSTHFTPAYLSSRALPDRKVFLYVTDIHPHPIWALKRSNIIYLVPIQYTKELLISYGIKPTNIRVASFPINTALLDGNSQRHQRRLKNLKAEKTTDILIISGGAGTGKIQMQNLLNTFAAPAHAHKVTITFLASTRNLRDALKETRLQSGLPNECVIIDTYKPDVLYKAMRQAEILITKAGGDITFEAIAEGLPVYTLKDVGDHERINRLYLEQLGVSKPLETGVYPWELIHHDLLTGDVTKMAENSHRAGEFHRASTVPKVIFEEMEWHR